MSKTAKALCLGVAGVQLVAATLLVVRLDDVRGGVLVHHPRWTPGQVDAFTMWAVASDVVPALALLALLWRVDAVRRVTVTVALLFGLASLSVGPFLAGLVPALEGALRTLDVVQFALGVAALAMLWAGTLRRRGRFRPPVLPRSWRDLAVCQRSPLRVAGGVLTILLWLPAFAAVTFFVWVWVVPVSDPLRSAGWVERGVAVGTAGLLVMVVLTRVDRAIAGTPGREWQPTVKTVAVVLFLCAAALLPWLLVRGTTLHGQAEVRDWSTTWIGLDVLEAAGLAATGALTLRDHPATVIAATFTGTLFLLDAWFDVLLASAGPDWYQALLVAGLFELPLTTMCFGIAVRQVSQRSRTR